MIILTLSSYNLNSIECVMVSVHVSSAIDRGYKFLV
jgi:hypothetical protein